MSTATEPALTPCPGGCETWIDATDCDLIDGEPHCGLCVRLDAEYRRQQREGMKFWKFAGHSPRSNAEQAGGY